MAAKTILATANDYIRDLQEHLAPQFLHKMMRGCFKRITVAFVQQLLAPKKYNCRNDNDTNDMYENINPTGF